MSPAQELSGAIQPGSDSHLQWAVTYRDAVQEAEDSGQLADAAAAAEDTPGQRGGRTGRKGGGAGFGGAGSGKGQAAAAPAAVEHTVEAADALCYKAFCTRCVQINVCLSVCLSACHAGFCSGPCAEGHAMHAIMCTRVVWLFVRTLLCVQVRAPESREIR